MSARYPAFDGTQACAEVGVESFFSDSGNETEATLAARQICAGCPFQAECLEYAVHWNVEGIWGGTNLRERRRIRSDRGIVAQPLVEFDRTLMSRRVKQLIAQGLTADVIAESLGISRRAVQRKRSAGAA